MPSVITLKGIDQAISNLSYRNKNTLKCRLVNVIRDFYDDETSVGALQSINPDELIKVLWDVVEDPATIKNKRKNLSSIKSSVNTNLKNLYKGGTNPEGIIIGPTNIFTMSSEAKDKVLEEFKTSIAGGEVASLVQILDILSIVNDILSDPKTIEGERSSSGPGKFSQLKGIIHGLSEKVGLAVPDLIQRTIERKETKPEKNNLTGNIFATEAHAETLQSSGLEKNHVGEGLEGEGIIDLDEEKVPDHIENVEIHDAIEELDIEEDLEDIEDTDDLEQVETLEFEYDEGLEVVEVEDENTLEEVGELEETEETDILVSSLGDKYSDEIYQNLDEISKARLLAEEFNHLLGVIERYYNQYILIPEGDYIVGSKHPKKDEKPEEIIHLSQFYAGKFPVTNALFEIFVEKTGYRTTAEKLGHGTVYFGRFQKIVDEKTGLERLTWNSAMIKKTVEGAFWYQPFGPRSNLHNKRNHPVVQVSLKDAIAFAAWTGKRIPTEHEWEAASRTANGYVFPWGNNWKKASCNIEESYIGDTTSVDKHIEFANDFGIVDTIGNVLEWTIDSFELDCFLEHRSKYHIVKGGSWISGDHVPVFSRFKLNPESHSNILGFRCVT